MIERRIIETIVSLRVWVVAFIVLVTGLALTQAMKVEFDASIDSWFLQGDADLITYERFLERFQADELTVIGVFADDLFTVDRLSRLHAMTEAAQQAPWVTRVRSMTHLRTLSDQGGVLSVGELLPHPPKTAEEAAGFRHSALSNPLVAGGFVTPTGDGTAIIVELDPAGNNFDAKIEQVVALRAMTEKLRGDMTTYLVGSPPVDEALLIRTARDYRILGPVMALVIALSFSLLFRRVWATVLGLSVVGIADIWLLGVMGLFDFSINIISSALAAMVLAVGVAHGVHVLNAYYRRLSRGQDPQEAVVDCTAKLLLPLFFTTATTAAGFLSLRVSDLKPVSEMGALAAMGVVFAFILTITLLPIALPLTSKAMAPGAERPQGQWFAGAAAAIAGMSRRTAIAVVSVSTLLAVLSLVGLSSIEVGANVMNYFLPDDPMRVQQAEVDRRLGGTAHLEFLVEAPDSGLIEPENLARLDKLERWLETLPGVSHSFSVVDLLAELNKTLSGADEAQIPDSRELAAQLLFLLEGEEDLDALIQDDASVGRVSARTQISEAKTLVPLIPEIEAKLAREFGGDDLKVSFTGYWKLVSEMEEYLVESQIQSFIVAFGAITAMMFLLLRSLWLGLFAMIPNLLPIVLGLGLMALTGIALDPGTTMIGCIALGLVVDDTVHLLTHLRRHLSEGDDLDTALQTSLEEVGPAVVITSVVLALGFAVLALGSFTPNRNFGLVSAAVVILALLADLVVLPAALKLVRPSLGAEQQAMAKAPDSFNDGGKGDG